MYRHIYTALFEAEGHQVTAATDIWGVVAVLRTSLHPVVCLYYRDLEMRRLLLADEEHVAALEANRADLARHRYVAVAWNTGPLPPRLAAIEDALDVDRLLQPFSPHDLHAAVQRAAERFPA